jgi:toxin-antitoxin system PIN domain toxin
VIFPDVNLLLYAQVSSYPEHPRAQRWWEGLLNGDKEVALAAPVLFGFVRLATSPRVFDKPMAVDDALDRANEWLAMPHVHLATPGPRHLEIAFRLLRELGTASNLTTDAQVAALAIEHQGEVHSNDADFSRFPQLRWVNPLR